MSGEVLDTVREYIRKNRLVLPGTRLVAAVSGGPDSVCLLQALVELQAEYNLELHVAHLDHQMRGEESADDAAYVRELAERLKLSATIGRRDVREYRAAHHLSLEEAAREVRYGFLAEVAGSVGADRVAVGHTTDDHIETVLLHLVRGGGIRGLRGLRPVSQWPYPGGNLMVIRPLLAISRQETADYCRRRRLAPRTDASNLSLSPLRNRLRQQLLPLLESYNPRIREALQRTALIAGDDLDYLEQQVTLVRDRVRQVTPEAVYLVKRELRQLHPALRRYILLEAIEKIRGSVKDIEMRHIEDMMKALEKPAGTSLNLPRGLSFLVEYDQYILSPAPEKLVTSSALAEEIKLNIPGTTLLPGWSVEAGLAAAGEARQRADIYRACFDFERTGKEITVRGRRPGDRFYPLGMDQPKKLSEFMVDAKVPRAGRDRIPVVTSPEQLLWVVGWRIDDRVKVTPATRQVLCLHFKKVIASP